jgi:hypothetical protein
MKERIFKKRGEEPTVRNYPIPFTEVYGPIAKNAL